MCEPSHPGGIGCYGYIIFKNHRKYKIGQGCIGYNATNNIAEYLALVNALEALKADDDDILIYTDSQTLAKHLTDESHVRVEHLNKICSDLNELLREKKWNIKWIPRRKNKVADKLSKKAFEKVKKYYNIRPFYEGKEIINEFSSCYYCRWKIQTGSHSGCYLGGSWRGWIPKKKLKKGSCEEWEQAR